MSATSTKSKTGKSYEIDFVVIGAPCTPLLGSSNVQVMGFIQVKYENIMTVEKKVKSGPLLFKLSLIKEFPVCLLVRENLTENAR